MLTVVQYLHAAGSMPHMTVWCTMVAAALSQGLVGASCLAMPFACLVSCMRRRVTSAGNLYVCAPCTSSTISRLVIWSCTCATRMLPREHALFELSLMTTRACSQSVS